MSVKLSYLLSIGLVTGVLLLTSACRDASPAGRGDVNGVAERTVEIIPVSERKIERVVVVFGSFRAREQATLSAKVSGRLESISVDLGSAIEAGSELARFEPRDYELRVRQANAALAQVRARLGLSPDDETTMVDPNETSLVRQATAVLKEASANRERIARLHDQGVLSQAELDSAEASFTIADNRHQVALDEIHQGIALLEQRLTERDIAAQQLTDSVVYAPFDASVQERGASPGEFLRAGDPILTLVQVDPLRLRLEVSERDAPLIRPGLPVRATVEGTDEVHVGKLDRISPAIDRQRRVLWVESDIANEGRIHPGMFARAEIVVNGADAALTVPTNSIVTFAGIEKVFVIDEGMAAERVVVTGVRRDGWVEVTQNIHAGDEVIVNPGNLQNGQKVAIQDPGQTIQQAD